MRRASWCALVVALAATTLETGRAQSAWPFVLRWEHDGVSVSYFEVCVDDRCSTVNAQRVPDSDTWNVAVPAMSQGEHRLVVRACNSGGCTAGQPDVFVRVTPVTTGPSMPGVPPPSKAKPRP